MAFVKRPNFLDIYTGQTPGKLGQALQMVTLGFAGVNENPFEVVGSYLSNTIVPVLNDPKFKDTAGVQKKCAELQMTLMQMQQNMEIPEIKLELDPFVIQEFKAKSELIA